MTTFGGWLRRIAGVGGWGSSTELRDVLVKRDCHCSTSQVDAWLDGASDPSFDKMRSIVSALQKELPDMDVWDHYRRFISDDAPGDVPSTPSSSTPATLETALRNNPLLPPGLSDG
jgi:hypothetical protein